MVRVIFVCLSLSVVTGPLFGQPPPPAENASSGYAATDHTAGLAVGVAPLPAQTLLRDLAVAAIPTDFEEDKDWDRRKEVWDGLHVRMDGLKVRTKRKWKEAKHGTWKRYRVNLIDPEENLRVRITNLKEIRTGVAAFDLQMAAKLDLQARLQQWQRDVRLLSVTAEAVADVDLNLGMEMSTSLDTKHFPPDIRLHPVATAAELRLVQFKLRRLGHADGPIIRELGDGLEDVLRRQLEKKRPQLVQKVNRAMKKNDDKLVLSIQEVWQNHFSGSDTSAAASSH